MFETHISVLLGCSSDFETHITVLLGCWGVLQMFETHISVLLGCSSDVWNSHIGVVGVLGFSSDFKTHISVLLGWHWQISEHWGPYRSLRLHARSLKMPRMSFWLIKKVQYRRILQEYNQECSSRSRSTCREVPPILVDMYTFRQQDRSWNFDVQIVSTFISFLLAAEVLIIFRKIFKLLPESQNSCQRNWEIRPFLIKVTQVCSPASNGSYLMISWFSNSYLTNTSKPIKKNFAFAGDQKSRLIK